MILAIIVAGLVAVGIELQCFSVVADGFVVSHPHPHPDPSWCASRKKSSTVAFGTATTNAATTTTTTSSSSSNNDECILWLPYSQDLLNNDTTSVVRTEHQVACRVLVDAQQDRYEFGTLDLSVSPPCCVLHSDPSQQQQHCQEFEIAVQNENRCESFHWAHMSFDVDPLGPNIVPVGKAYSYSNADGSKQELQESETPPDIAICKCRPNNNNNNDNDVDSDDSEVIGRMFLQDRFFGHCGYLSNDNKEVYVGGNFYVLSAIPKPVQSADTVGTCKDPQHRDDDDDDDNDTHQRRKQLVTEIQKRVDLYLSDQDRRLIESISGHSVAELMREMSNPDVVSVDVLSRVLSTDRFIAHGALNTKGLSLLRAVLAERMTLARRRRFQLDRHPDTQQWEADGVLLKDFDYYLDHPQELDALLQMVAASPTDVPRAASFQWVERNVTAVATDPQREPHIDTFHSVVKMWVYERGVVTAETGPLHFMRGSHRNSQRARLEWMYNASLPPATEAVREPSLRFRGNDARDMPEPLRPVLPLDGCNRTLIIADTSGIHHRGHAVPGTLRRTIRVSNGNDGGLPRLNPYVWDGWDGTTADQSQTQNDVERGQQPE